MSTDVLAGGLAAEKKVKPEDVNADELAAGVEIEKEHTKNEDLAREIALDHLAEIPDYYTRLKRMESEAKAERDAGKAVETKAADGDSQPKTEAKDDTGLSDADKQKIREFVSSHASPSDDDFHGFAESAGIDTHKAEAYVYELAHAGMTAKSAESGSKTLSAVDAKAASRDMAEGLTPVISHNTRGSGKPVDSRTAGRDSVDDVTCRKKLAAAIRTHVKSAQRIPGEGSAVPEYIPGLAPFVAAYRSGKLVGDAGMRGVDEEDLPASVRHPVLTSLLARALGGLVGAGAGAGLATASEGYGSAGAFLGGLIGVEGGDLLMNAHRRRRRREVREKLKDIEPDVSKYPERDDLNKYLYSLLIPGAAVPKSRGKLDALRAALGLKADRPYLATPLSNYLPLVGLANTIQADATARELMALGSREKKSYVTPPAKPVGATMPGKSKPETPSVMPNGAIKSSPSVMPGTKSAPNASTSTAANVPGSGMDPKAAAVVHRLAARRLGSILKSAAGEGKASETEKEKKPFIRWRFHPFRNNPPLPPPKPGGKMTNELGEVISPVLTTQEILRRGGGRPNIYGTVK